MARVTFSHTSRKINTPKLKRSARIEMAVVACSTSPAVNDRVNYNTVTFFEFSYPWPCFDYMPTEFMAEYGRISNTFLKLPIEYMLLCPADPHILRPNYNLPLTAFR